MGLFSRLKPSRTVMVVDGVSLNESLGMKGKVAPRNQLQMLRRLSRFAQREKIEVAIVLTGSPLHKAPPKEKFEEITVLYSETPEKHLQYIVKVARSFGAGAILVSGAGGVEALAGSSLRTLRMSTFRKAFDVNSNEGESTERDGGNRGGRNRPPRRRQQQKPSGENSPEQPPKERSEADAINELIDLVD